jgi:predicted GNAT superfamily acetyltransferase
LIQGGACTLDWPFDPTTGIIKGFGIAQLKAVARAVKGIAIKE